MDGLTGWIQCPTCDGTTLALKRDELGRQLGAQEEDCPDCSAGRVPSDEEVIEAAVAMSRVPEGPGLELNARVWPRLARSALIAADRWRREQAAQCHHDWYRGPDSPPDTCLKCGARKDNG